MPKFVSSIFQSLHYERRFRLRRHGRYYRIGRMVKFLTNARSQAFAALAPRPRLAHDISARRRCLRRACRRCLFAAMPARDRDDEVDIRSHLSAAFRREYDKTLHCSLSFGSIRRAMAEESRWASPRDFMPATLLAYDASSMRRDA